MSDYRRKAILFIVLSITGLNAITFMGDKSFYDLDYIIELNEKRLESFLPGKLSKNAREDRNPNDLLFDYRHFCCSYN